MPDSPMRQASAGRAAVRSGLRLSRVECGAGAFGGLPKYAPGAVVRAGKSECAAYLDLATSYAKGAEDVRKAIAAHQQAYLDVRRPPSPVHCGLDIHIWLCRLAVWPPQRL